MQILIIDDEIVARNWLKDALEDLPCTIDEAPNGRVALEMIKTSGNFDLVLIDWKTPVMSGLELTKAIRSDPSLNDLKLVMVTGCNELADVEEALNAGVNEYLMKPFTRDMILDKLRMIGSDIPDNLN